MDDATNPDAGALVTSPSPLLPGDVEAAGTLVDIARAAFESEGADFALFRHAGEQYAAIRAPGGTVIVENRGN